MKTAHTFWEKHCKNKVKIYIFILSQCSSLVKKKCWEMKWEREGKRKVKEEEAEEEKQEKQGDETVGCT